MAYGIRWIDADANGRFCELEGANCYEAHHTLADAQREADAMNRLAISEGWTSRYVADMLPPGVTPHFADRPGLLSASAAVIASFDAAADCEDEMRLEEARRVGGEFVSRRSEDGWNEQLAARLADVRAAYAPLEIVDRA